MEQLSNEIEAAFTTAGQVFAPAFLSLVDKRLRPLMECLMAKVPPKWQEELPSTDVNLVQTYLGTEIGVLLKYGAALYWAVDVLNVCVDNLKAGHQCPEQMKTSMSRLKAKSDLSRP